MAIGDDALAAGMALVNGAAAGSAAQIDDYINTTRDYIAQRTSTVTPVLKGGTGATTASAARTNLGISALNTPATGAGGSDVQTWLGFLDLVKVSNSSAGTNSIVLRHDGSGFLGVAVDGADQGRLAKDSQKVNRTGDTMTGDLYIPGSSAATSSFTVCYINGDGRVSRGSSSERYKKYIHDAPDLGDLFAAPLREYQMRADGTMPDDGVKHIGYIAEELVGTDMERFVVEVGGQVESIDFIALLLAQNAQLNARISALESGA